MARIDSFVLDALDDFRLNPFEDAPQPLEARLVRDWPKFLARWGKLEKAAKKLGVDVGYEEVGEIYEPVDPRRPQGPQRKVHRIQLWGDAPKIEGWEFLARIDMLDHEHSTVAFAPGKEAQLDPALWQGGTNCDHCKVKRFRVKRYVLRNVETGEVMVVGATCLKDFLGHAAPETIALIASYLSEFNDLGAPDEGEGGGGSPSSHFFGVSELMPLLVALTKRLGFVSVKAADESMTKQSTTATLLHILYQPRDPQARDAWVEFRKQMAPTPEDKEFAQLVIEWAKGLTGTSSYELNIRALAEADVCGYRQLSLLASMPHAYMRAAGMRQQREGRALPESKHVGTVGESITLTLHLRKIVEWDTAYGTTTMLMFSTPEGDDVVWKASKWPKVEGTDERVQEGDTYVVKGKVKEHGDYKGRPQTRIERAKILSQVDVPSHIGKPRENPEQSWEAKRAEIAQHRMHAAAARQQARYDAEAREAVAYHDAEAERLEDELVAAGHRRPRGARYRKNPVVDDWVEIEDAAFADHAHDAHGAPVVDDWITIEECSCSSCRVRMNPRAPKRRAEGAYGDLESIAPVIENALAQHGLTMSGISEVTFTRGSKTRAGSCAYSPSLRQCKIMFNGIAWPAFTEEQRLNTVLHEAAHAIQFLTTGRSDHGPVWTRIAKSIGCTGDRCMSVEASQAMVDAYAEAKGLPKRQVLTREAAMEASGDFAVGDYVSFEHKRATWAGKIVGKSPTHATVLVQDPPTKAGVTGKIPYPLLQKTAPPRFADKVAGVDKPAAGESLTAWLERTGRSSR